MDKRSIVLSTDKTSLDASFLPMYEVEIDAAIRQLQAGSIEAPVHLTLIANTPACTLEQCNLIARAIYTVLDDAHLQISKTGKSFPIQQVLCLASLASIISRPHVCSRVHATLQAWVFHWAGIHRWILYLKSDFVDREGIELSFRILAKRSIVDFLGVCNESFLHHMFEPIVTSTDVIATLFSVWRLETEDSRFSLPDDPSSYPMFYTQATLDSWLCSFVQRERWDWSEILRPFGGEADALAATALDRLRQDAAREPVNYNLVIWDIHLITNFSVNEVIRISLLNQKSMTTLTNVINSMVGRYDVTNQRSLVAKCISFGYWYICNYVESTEGLPLITQLVEAGLLSAMLSTEPWIKYLNGQDSEDWESFFVLLRQIIPKYSVYGSVLRPIARQLTKIDTDGLPGKLDQGGSLLQSWSTFQRIVRHREAIYYSTASNGTHIESCQNEKCDKSGPPGSLKSCANCLRVYYCSRACQVYDWKNGGHQRYCRDIQVRRTKGLVSRLSGRDLRFINRVITQDLAFFRDRIQDTAITSNVGPVIVELDYTEIPTHADIGSIRTTPAIGICECDVVVARKWDRMVELAQKSASRKVLVRAFLPGGASEKVKHWCLPLQRILGDCHPTTDEDPVSEFDETFDLLCSRVQSDVTNPSK